MARAQQPQSQLRWAARPRRRRASRTLRRTALWGAPLALAAGLGIGAVMSGNLHGPRSLQDIANAGFDLSAKLGLVVTDIQVEGRHTTDAATILSALDARYGTPILAVNPARAKRQLEALPWVRSASIERRLPGTIAVDLVERRPLAVWQHDGKQELIDQDGTVIPVSDLSRFAKLPTVVGDDQARHGAAQLLGLLASEPDIDSRVTAVVFVGDRRWNVRIDEDEGGRLRGRFLVVTRLGPGGVCRVGTVDATNDPDANQAARLMADKYARAFRCGTDKPNEFRD